MRNCLEAEGSDVLVLLASSANALIVVDTLAKFPIVDGTFPWRRYFVESDGTYLETVAELPFCVYDVRDFFQTGLAPTGPEGVSTIVLFF